MRVTDNDWAMLEAVRKATWRRNKERTWSSPKDMPIDISPARRYERLVRLMKLGFVAAKKIWELEPNRKLIVRGENTQKRYQITDAGLAAIEQHKAKQKTATATQETVDGGLVAG